MHYYPFGEELPDLKLLLNHITECLSGTSGVRQLAPTALLHCSTTHARSLVAGLFLCPDWNWDMMAAPPHGATNCDPTCARVPPLPGAFHFFVVAVWSNDLKRKLVDHRFSRFNRSAGEIVLLGLTAVWSAAFCGVMPRM
jgi:hypothetical protein